MMVVDADSGKIVAMPRIGFGPYASGLDPDTQLVFSLNGAGTLTVIHGDSPNRYTVLGDARTDWLARHLAIDQKTHAVYTVLRPGATRRFFQQNDPNRYQIKAVSRPLSGCGRVCWSETIFMSACRPPDRKPARLWTYAIPD
jgi:hypothetical protein